MGPLTAARREPKLTTSKLLPQILELKEQGLTYRQIGERLGITRSSVEHVIVRQRERQRKQEEKSKKTENLTKPVLPKKPV